MVNVWKAIGEYEDWVLKLCEKALFTLQHANMVRSKTESDFNRGYRLGWYEARELGIRAIEGTIEELKRE